MAGVPPLERSVTRATEEKVSCVLNRAQRGRSKETSNHCLHWGKEFWGLGSAWFFSALSNNLWEGFRITYSPLPPRLRVLADTISDWHFLSWTFYLTAHCKWNRGWQFSISSLAWPVLWEELNEGLLQKQSSDEPSGETGRTLLELLEVNWILALNS